jgi:hypothetical protein
MPLNFFFIIVVQSIVLIFLAVRRRTQSGYSFAKVLALSLLPGIILGTFFDLIGGIFVTHSYILTPSAVAPLCPCGLTFAQLLWNGVLSYGIAVATAYYIVQGVTTVTKKRAIVLASAPLIVLLASIYKLFTLPKGTVEIFFACGFAVVAIGELLLLTRGTVGPILAAFVNRDIATLARGWLMVVLVAVSYELANHLFPFWKWVEDNGTSTTQVELLVIIFAYAGLFHPMIIFWQLLQRHTVKP